MSDEMISKKEVLKHMQSIIDHIKMSMVKIDMNDNDEEDGLDMDIYSSMGCEETDR